MAIKETIDSRNILVRSFRPEQVVPGLLPSTVNSSFRGTGALKSRGTIAELGRSGQAKRGRSEGGEKTFQALHDCVGTVCFRDGESGGLPVK
jgi:hypothetical protein